MSLFFIDLDKEFDDRLDIARFFRFENNNYDPLTSTFIQELRELPSAGEFIVQNEEGRPELVSFRIYGTTQHWWILLIYNDILETDGFTNGDVIRFPSLDSIDDLFFSLRTRETALGS